MKLKNTCYNTKVKQLKSHLISLQEEQKKHTLAALKEYNKLLKNREDWTIA